MLSLEEVVLEYQPNILGLLTSNAITHWILPVRSLKRSKLVVSMSRAAMLHIAISSIQDLELCYLVVTVSKAGPSLHTPTSTSLFVRARSSSTSFLVGSSTMYTLQEPLGLCEPGSVAFPASFRVIEVQN